MRKILSWGAFLGGEIILLVAFQIWGSGLPVDIRVLDTVISMLILCLFFVDLLIPWVNWKGGSQKRLGSLGLRWVFTWIYASVAVVVMLLCQLVFAVAFLNQLLIHIILLLGLILGFAAVSSASERIEEVHVREANLLRGPREMMSHARRLQNLAMETGNLPEEFRVRIGQLVEELRFVSPCSSDEASELEKQFADTIRSVEVAIPSCDMNRETITLMLARAERLCSQRKALHN